MVCASRQGFEDGGEEAFEMPTVIREQRRQNSREYLRSGS
ncbi:hypothetical protein Y717_25910 [Streptomyces scopuliridis RB72]|uniref:Uncharacterized protein n=1 Tax=Streptomyces scopuliridis RB72 TaxID=1440053 RepID=A0A2T7T470_9ACTN|nr:hypothetical protein Y717_25910 [Streptomyces scopuliridis RB72]